MTKQLRLFIILLFLSTSTFAQHTFTWQRTYGSPELDDFAEDILQTAEGDYVFTGSANGSTANNYDIYLVKTDRVGNILWTRFFGGEGMDKGAKVVTTQDNGFAIVGMTQSFSNGGDSDVYLVRTDSEGHEMWSMTYRQPSTNEGGLGLAATADGGFIISGYAESATGDEELYLLKIREDGSVQWSNQYGGLQDERGHAVVTTPDGGYAVAGFTQSIGSGKKDGFLLKTDFVGNEIWARAYGNAHNNIFYDLANTNDGGFVMTGSNEFTSFVAEDLYIVKTDDTGNQVWDRSFGGSFQMTGYAITATETGSFFVAGERSFPDGGVSKDIFLMNISQTGIPIWQETHGGSLDEGALAAAQTADGGFIVAGWQTNIAGINDMDAFLLKMNFEGQIDTTFTVIVEQSEAFRCHGEDSGTIDVWVTGGQYPYTYEWNQEDIEGFSLDNLTAGNYTVTVTGADNQVAIHQSSFIEPAQLLVDVSPTAAESCAGNADGRALAFASGGTGEFTYLWDNGETSAFANNLSAGLHLVSVTDENDCTTVSAVFISAGPDGEPTASFEFETNNLDLHFRADIMGEASEISWDFGDGSSSEEANPNHLFAADGTYEVCLSVGNSCGDTQTCQSITVMTCSDDPLTAVFEANLNAFTASFSHPSAVNADSHLWSFGDGQSSTEATPTHTFTRIGDYEVCLTVQNACGEHQQCNQVRIAADSSTTVLFKIEDIRSLQDTIAQVPVYVQRFHQVINFQGSINIEDLGIANFKEISQFNLPNMDEANFFIESSDILTFNWIDETGAGVSLDDDSPLFTIEVFLPGASGACTPLSFSDHTIPLELQKLENGTLVESPIQSEDGEVCRIDRIHIDGQIKRENGTPINEVGITCGDNTHLTDFEGQYNFVIPASEPCEMMPDKNVNHPNGVSSFDIVLIRKHILDVSRLDSPYKIIAADVNGSGTVSGLDMVIMRKLILNDIQAFPDAPSWRFVPADFEFPNPENPFETPYPLSISLDQADRDVEHQDFIAVKTGDVNYSAIPNLQQPSPEDRSMSSLSFELIAGHFEAQEQLRLPIRAKDFQAITGFQFNLNIQTDLFDFQQIVPIELENFTASNFSYKDGDLAVSWTAADVELGQSLDDEAILFYIEGQALKDAQVSDVFQLNENRISAEAYDKNLEIFDLNINIVYPFTDDRNLEVSIYPNPVQASTTLSLVLPTAGKLQVTLMDTQGRLVRQLWTNDSVDKGVLQKELKFDDLELGIYYLVVDFEGEREVRKVVKVE